MNWSSVILCTEVFPCICLVEDHHCGWLELLCLKSSSGCHSETQGKVVEVEDADWGVLRDVFSHPCYVGFYHVISIEVGHLSSWFHPNFVFAILGQIVQTADMKSEFAALGEFSDEKPSCEKFLSGDIGAHAGDGGIDIKDPVFDESEDRLRLPPINEIL